MTAAFEHTTVLLDETVAALSPVAGGVYIDATVGGGGHAAKLLEAGAPDSRLIAFDRDPAALEAARERLAPFGDRVLYVHSAFSRIEEVLLELELEQVDGLVADLGVSSPQLDRADRGFSFARPGPLDMRMDPTQGETALELIARLDEEELANLLFELGEERRSRRIARAILRAHEAGELETTDDLRETVARAVGGRRGRIDPSTRTFQALRIAVNRELEELDALLSMLARILSDGAVAAIISFHSLEDRRVKWAFRRSSELEPLYKKPVVAKEGELAGNPRARSAKLRAARRLPRGRA